MKNTFEYQLNDRVKLAESNESGVVVGRSEYSHRPPCYLIRYCAADGRQVEDWWPGDAIDSSLKAQSDE